MFSHTLFMIPARGGSKGIPGKNIRPLNGKPLIYYTIEFARLFVADKDICVSTDSEEIAKAIREINYEIPFLRPVNLAGDETGSDEVLLHAVAEFEKQNREYNTIILLQPTSPFRLQNHLTEAFGLYSSSVDMVVSVKESQANPYYNLFEETPLGYLKKSKEGNFVRRQDCPRIYQYNGSIYIINIAALKSKPLREFSKVVKYVMPEKFSVDLDTPLDWVVAEMIIRSF